ncbi:alpha/beta fold hydrolase [Ferroplasma sp.]|uniref:alpha/beta fold hydrolase n=1 Tax=Ferroplasma sp. TaxID=2591003 RepID=UPI00307CE3CC
MYNIVEDKIKAQSLHGNPLGDAWEREIIRIENNVDSNTPVFIGLPGFFGSGNSFMNKSYTSFDFRDVLEKLGQEYEYIIILPDTMTKFGGNQFVDSTAIGNYKTYIAEDIVNFIHKLYGKRDIYLFGKSSGGFGSISLTMDYPDLFKGFIDISGDSYFQYSYMQDFPTAYKTIKASTLKDFIETYRKSFTHSQDELTAYNVIAMAASYSPDGLNINLPFSLDTGEIINEIWEKWLEFDPVNRLKTEINKLRNKIIVLQTGNKDEFRIDIGMNMIHKILEENKIKHYYREYAAGHFNINYFYLDSFPEILKIYK